jgi:hypothetical protein
MKLCYGFSLCVKPCDYFKLCMHYIVLLVLNFPLKNDNLELGDVSTSTGLLIDLYITVQGIDMHLFYKE